MNGRSKQEIETAVSGAMSKFLKEQMCEQAETVSTQVMENIIILFDRIYAPYNLRRICKKSKLSGVRFQV